METINWNNFGEGSYESIDYITFSCNGDKGYALNLELVTGLSLGEDRVELGLRFKNGFQTFSRFLSACPELKLTARCSNYHGGYLLVTATVTFTGEEYLSLPDDAQITFMAKDVKVDTFSTHEETAYLTEIQPRE